MFYTFRETIPRTDHPPRKEISAYISDSAVTRLLKWQFQVEMTSSSRTVVPVPSRRGITPSSPYRSNACRTVQRCWPRSLAAGQRGSGDNAPAEPGQAVKQLQGGNVTDCDRPNCRRLLTLRWPDDVRLFIFAIFFSRNRFLPTGRDVPIRTPPDRPLLLPKTHRSNSNATAPRALSNITNAVGVSDT